MLQLPCVRARLLRCTPVAAGCVVLSVCGACSRRRDVCPWPSWQCVCVSASAVCFVSRERTREINECRHVRDHRANRQPSVGEA